MTDLAEFPDVEKCLVQLLTDLADTGTETPPNLESVLPFLRVTCTGGRDDFVTDTSRFDVHAFAGTKAAAADLAGKVRQRLLGKPHTGNGWVLDRVTTLVKPHEQPYVDDPPPWRYVASYSASARRSAATG